ncbi:MAG: hypothetical protein ABSG31_02955 [Tepidisphaeraceae bacterium]|jgi:hypothetical protein
MSTTLRRRIQQEVELIQRFTGSYSKQFDEMINRLNVTPDAPPPDGQCLRLCVEAVNMVLSMQGQLAQVLDEISREPIAG